MNVSNRHYHDRRPQQRHQPSREHYAHKQGGWKPKQPFPSERKAKHWLSRHWWMKRDGYMAYQCSVCGCWHIGKSTD